MTSAKILSPKQLPMIKNNLSSNWIDRHAGDNYSRLSGDYNAVNMDAIQIVRITIIIAVLTIVYSLIGMAIQLSYRVNEPTRRMQCLNLQECIDEVREGEMVTLRTVY